MTNRELDPITLQVISGALDTIAEEMGHVALPHVLLVDHPRIPGPRRRALRYRVQHPVRVGVDPAPHRITAGLPRRRREGGAGELGGRGRRHPQPPLLRFEPLARHRGRHPHLLPRRAGRLLGQHRPPPGHRGRHAGTHHRHPGRLRGGDAVRGDQALRGGPAQRDDVGLHPQQLAGVAATPRRPRRPDRVRAARGCAASSS